MRQVWLDEVATSSKPPAAPPAGGRFASDRRGSTASIGGGILADMSTDNNAALVRQGFEAFLRGDFDALRELLAPYAQWLWWEPIPGDCHDPDTIIRTLRERHAEGVVTGLNDIVAGGEKLVVEVTGPQLEQRGLPDRQACMVVTMRDGRIVRMQDHASREDALFDAGLARRVALPEPAPLEHTEAGWDQVSGLVPFVHVSDITASVRFYEQLGFHISASHPTQAPVPSWVSLESRDAGLMLQQTEAPIDADSQAVLFYLFARDLFGLRERLITTGIDAGEIVNGASGPNAEMRVKDPDGYVLMIAQIEAGRDN
jgi:ketosteroid isomerase-like protein/catechol 2,3-dioxygenase-like lactoylglutathione lyase family enzyme